MELAKFISPALVEPLRSLARSRLALFVIAGGVLYRAAPPPEATGAADVVRVSSAELGMRELMARRTTGAALTSEADGARLRQQAVEDALLEHEARRLGLADDDLVVRRRLVQKALFLAEDLGGAFREPSETELRAFHASHPGDFRLAGRTRFVHVFAADESKLDALRAQVEAFMGSRPDEAPPFGDAFALPRSVNAPEAEIADRYGPELASAVRAAPVGGWSGPHRSKFGHHLVKIVGREEGRASSFEEVASHVAFAYLVDRRQRAIDDFIRSAFERVRVEVDGERVTTLPRSHRLATRDEASAEDGL